MGLTMRRVTLMRRPLRRVTPLTSAEDLGSMPCVNFVLASFDRTKTEQGSKSNS